jgi:hypothetical protein
VDALRQIGRRWADAQTHMPSGTSVCMPEVCDVPSTPF